MSELVIMPLSDWTAALEATKAKTGKNNKIKSGELAAEIEGITGSGGKPFDCRSVTFMHNGAELYVRSVGDGDTCADPVARGLIEAPTKESTAQYTYPHNGWSLTDGGSASSSALTNVTEDRTVYAAFSQATRYYTISFYDGETLLTTKQVAYGGSATYTPPAKDGYFFSKWDPEPTNITGDMACYAQYKVDVDFATASWEDIAAVSERGEAADYFKLGEKKQITFNDVSGVSRTMNVIIIGINKDQTQDGKTVGLTMMTEYFAGDCQLNKSTVTYNGNTGNYAGGWASCELRTTLNSTVLASMDNSLQGAIKAVKKESNTYLDGSTQNWKLTTYDKLWLLSYGDVIKSASSNSFTAENGNQYDGAYDINGNFGYISTLFTNMTDANNNNGVYFLRTGSYSNANRVAAINTANRYIISEYGNGLKKLIFCFCV